MRNEIFKHKAFIPFIMAGYPSMDATKDALYALENAKVDLIELGVPFSDPVADGVVNQLASDAALFQGATLDAILNLVKSIKEDGFKTPIILFSYFNPILAYGLDAFVADARDAGVAGVLIVDLPPEEGEVFYTQLKKNGLEIVLLVCRTTNIKRFSLIKKLAPLFIYYISRCAVTGLQHTLSPRLHEDVMQIKSHFHDYPIAVGFGISTIEHAQLVGDMAHGVVVGSALVDTLGREGVESFQTLANAFSKAVHTIGVNHDY